jgi:hypothetical protein
MRMCAYMTGLPLHGEAHFYRIGMTKPSGRCALLPNRAGSLTTYANKRSS